MNTLTPKIIEKFRPAFSVSEYEELLGKYSSTATGYFYTMYKGGNAKKEYWGKLPKFVLAKCPLCGAEHTDKIDLHTTTLVKGSKVDHSLFYFYKAPPYKGCDHLVRMATFINFNGQKPEGVYLGSEVPYVTDCLFPDEIDESYAVINAFPLCRIEGDKFVPAYTWYILTYYGREPDKLRVLKVPEWAGMFRPVLYNVDEAWEHRDKKIFDLKYWVEQGRLFWMDEEKGKTILRNDPKTFPYVNIEGYVENMVFKDGEIYTRLHDNPPRYYPDWKPEDWSKKQWKHFYKNEKRDPHARRHRSCLVAFFIPIVLFVLAVVTSLFFWPIIDPVWAWIFMFTGIGLALYFIVKSSFSLHKEGEITLSQAISHTAIDIFGLLLTTGTAVFAGGWAVRKIGLFILAQTNIEWLGVCAGMLGAFVVGFGAGKIVSYIWEKVTKRFR